MKLVSIPAAKSSAITPLPFLNPAKRLIGKGLKYSKNLNKTNTISIAKKLAFHIKNKLTVMPIVLSMTRDTGLLIFSDFSYFSHAPTANMTNNNKMQDCVKDVRLRVKRKTAMPARDASVEERDGNNFPKPKQVAKTEIMRFPRGLVSQKMPIFFEIVIA